VNKKIVGNLVFILLVFPVLLLAGCVSEDKFADDPIEWSFVGGNGTWEANSRRWTVSLGPGETRSIEIKLYNSGSQRIIVCTVPVGPTDDRIWLSPQERVPIQPDTSLVITLTAGAYESARTGSHNYTIDYSHSFNEEQ
jgi:hypothetical protein